MRVPALLKKLMEHTEEWHSFQIFLYIEILFTTPRSLSSYNLSQIENLRKYKYSY